VCLAAPAAAVTPVPGKGSAPGLNRRADSRIEFAQRLVRGGRHPLRPLAQRGCGGPPGGGELPCRVVSVTAHGRIFSSGAGCGQAWRASASFEPSKEFGPWLATIARQAAIDIHRKEARHAHGALEDADPADPGLVSLPPSVDRAYDVWQVRQALSQLTPDEANLVRMQHMEGLTHSQIAERLNIPLGTVKSRSFRAHRHLAGLLGHLRGDDPAEGAAPRQSQIGTGGQR
jgi:RNA polymerase sigma-70 factor (ECF subfamily)